MVFHTIYLSRSQDHNYQAKILDSNRFRKLVGRAVRQKWIFDYIANWFQHPRLGGLPERASGQGQHDAFR